MNSGNCRVTVCAASVAAAPQPMDVISKKGGGWPVCGTVR